MKFANSGTFLFDIEFLGKEASFVNTFVFDGSTIFNTKDGGTSLSVGNIAGPFLLDASTFADLTIPFFFTIDSGNKPSVVNGSNPDDADGTPAQNFFVTCVDVATATSCDTIDIFLDDSVANDDDMAIRLTARVPKPDTLALPGLGLIGISLSRGRKT